MPIFDKSFSAKLAAPFEGDHSVSFEDPSNSELFEIAAVFNANQTREKVGNTTVTHTVYSVEFDGNYVDLLSISAGSIFVIDENRYKASRRPFIDDTGWATVELTLTN
ncbi:MAG: hypothetical protein M0R47_17080 [Methylobacter sp.]|uniref:hypothetical protein n=1 Tax=Methylobacter sp. TaxID=2051955 RepID=UPI0026007100|nr:hypothetical protein [Methylobacter sp.]MCK9622238.1 hypothetical protein [Methylobacter sp.]